MTLTIGICEDEPWFAADLKEKTEIYLRERGVAGFVRTFSRGEDLLDFPQNIDIVLMDIKLPGKDGMAIAKRMGDLGSGCQVIFITSYQKYVFQAFDVNAVHYLLKPVSMRKLYAALDKAVKRGAHNREKALFVSGKDNVARVCFREIVYCEVFDHQIVIHTMTKEYRISGTLDALERDLDERFFRCHRSYLVNMEFVADKGEGYAEMAGGGRVLISRRKQTEFTKRLLRVCRGEYI